MGWNDTAPHPAVTACYFPEAFPEGVHHQWSFLNVKSKSHDSGTTSCSFSCLLRNPPHAPESSTEAAALCPRVVNITVWFGAMTRRNEFWGRAARNSWWTDDSSILPGLLLVHMSWTHHLSTHACLPVQHARGSFIFSLCDTALPVPNLGGKKKKKENTTYCSGICRNTVWHDYIC